MTHDSRLVAAGHLFACVRGEHHDGHRYAAGAVARRRHGAARRPRASTSRPSASSSSPTPALAMGPVASGVYRVPEPRPAGRRRHRHERQDDDVRPARRDPRAPPAGRRPSSARCRARRRRPRRPSCRPASPRRATQGDRAVVMEVSSHALALHRVDGTRFAVGGVHEPRHRPPRPARHAGGVLPRQGPAVHAGAGGDRASATPTTPTAACCSTRRRSRWCRTRWPTPATSS